MFWKITLMTSKIDTILDKDNVTLKELMEEDDILQECKAQNRKLIGFLTQPKVMQELVELATIEPDPNSDEITRFKYTNIACELLTSDVAAINDALVANTDLLDLVYAFLEQSGRKKLPKKTDVPSPNTSHSEGNSADETNRPEATVDSQNTSKADTESTAPEETVTNHADSSHSEGASADAANIEADGQPNPLMASFFSKIINVLLNRRTEKLMNYLIERGTFLSLLVRHVATPAIADCIIQLFGMVDRAPTDSRRVLVDWLVRDAFIRQLINVIRAPRLNSGEPACDTEAFCNASQVLCEVVRSLREQSCLMTEKEDPERLLAIFDDPAVLDELFSNILPPRAENGASTDNSSAATDSSSGASEEAHVSAITNGLQFVQALLDFRKHLPAGANDALGDPSNAARGDLGGSNGVSAEMPFSLSGLGGPFGLTPTAFIMDSRRVQRTCDAVIAALRRNLPALIEVLRSPPRGIHRTVPTPAGRLLEAPCGAARIAVLSTLNTLLQTTLNKNSVPALANESGSQPKEEEESVLEDLLRFGYVRILIEALFAFPWNNFLHTQVERSLYYMFQALSAKLPRADADAKHSSNMTSNTNANSNSNSNNDSAAGATSNATTVISNDSNADSGAVVLGRYASSLLQMVRTAFTEANLLGRIMAAHADNITAERSGRPRAAFMGHLVRIANQASDLFVRAGIYEPSAPPAPPADGSSTNNANANSNNSAAAAAPSSSPTKQPDAQQQEILASIRAIWNDIPSETRESWRAFVAGPLEEINRANIIENNLQTGVSNMNAVGNTIERASASSIEIAKPKLQSQKHIQVDADSDEGETYAPILNEPKTSSVSLQRSFDEYQQLATHMVTNFTDHFGLTEASYTDVPRIADMENLLETKIASLTAFLNGPDEPSGASEFERLCNARLRSADEDDEDEEHEEANGSSSDSDDGEAEEEDQDTTGGDEVDTDSPKHTDEDDDSDFAQIRNDVSSRYAPLPVRSSKLPKLTLADDFTEKPLVFAAPMKTNKWDASGSGFEKLNLGGDSDDEVTDGAPRRSSDSDEDEDGSLTVRSSKNTKSQPNALGSLIVSRAPFFAWSSDDDELDSSKRTGAAASSNQSQSKRTSRYVPRFDDEDELEPPQAKVGFDDITDIKQDSFDDLVQRESERSALPSNAETSATATNTAGESEPSTNEGWADFAAFDSAMTSAGEGASDESQSGLKENVEPSTVTAPVDRSVKYALDGDVGANESES